MKEIEMALPLDYSRCHPKHVSDECRTCARWARLPGQTWGGRTPSTLAEAFDMMGCARIPVPPTKQREN